MCISENSLFSSEIALRRGSFSFGMLKLYTLYPGSTNNPPNSWPLLIKTAVKWNGSAIRLYSLHHSATDPPRLPPPEAKNSRGTSGRRWKASASRKASTQASTCPRLRRSVRCHEGEGSMALKLDWSALHQLPNIIHQHILETSYRMWYGMTS